MSVIDDWGRREARDLAEETWFDLGERWHLEADRATSVRAYGAPVVDRRALDWRGGRALVLVCGSRVLALVRNSWY